MLDSPEAKKFPSRRRGENKDKDDMSASVQANPEHVAVLTSMGFNEEQAKLALLRCDNDINRAADLLSNGMPMNDDAEFDLIAAANPEPAVRAPTVFQPRTGHAEGTEDHFRTGVTQGTISEMVDARISVFTEMGFSAEEATDALRRCNNDVNEALTMLLNR